MKFKTISLVIMFALSMAGCAVTDKIEDPLSAIRLPDAPKGSFWYDVDTHSTYYNQYMIDITSDPVPARIEIDGKYFATAPGSFPYTGQIYDRSRVKITAKPIDPGYKPAAKVLNGSRRLPKEMSFQLER